MEVIQSTGEALRIRHVKVIAPTTNGADIQVYLQDEAEELHQESDFEVIPYTLLMREILTTCQKAPVVVPGDYLFDV